MANVLTANPLKIDTAGGSALGLKRPIRIVKVYWLNPTTLGHTFQITDTGASPTDILSGRCEVANQSQVFDFNHPLFVKDIIVPTLQSGTLYIYYINY